MKNKAVKIIAVVIAAALALSFLKNQIIKTVVAAAASKTLGAQVKIGGLSLGIFTQRIIIRDLRVYNPKGFPSGELLMMPLIDVRCDLPALLAGKVHLPRVDINLKQMQVIKNKEGRLNVDSLQVAKKEDQPAGRETKKSPSFAIDYLRLNIGRIIYKDFTHGEKPLVQAYEVNIKDREYRNLNSPQQLAALVLVEGMKQTAIRGAQIYGVATLAGMAFLPVGVASMFAASDSATADFRVDFDRAFAVSSQALKELGSLQAENKAAGSLSAQVSGCDVNVSLKKVSNNSVKIGVSARKMLFPEKEIAAGVLSQIREKLEK